MKTTITALDFMNYLVAHWLPVSGFAISALAAREKPETILEVPKDEEDRKIYDKVLAWVRKQK